MNKLIKKIMVILLLAIVSTAIYGCDSKIPINLDPIVIDNNSPTGVTIKNSTNNYKMFVGDTLQLNAIVSPETAVQTVIWASNNHDIATIDENGLMTAHQAGKVKITATSTEKTTILAHAYFTVEEPLFDLTSIEITGVNEIFVDETVKFDFVKIPHNAAATVVWSVNDDSIASIDQNGRLKGIEPGIVEITIIANQTLSDTFSVTIKPRSGTPSELLIIGRSQVEVDQNIKLVVKSLPFGSVNTVVWSSSNESIATISNEGVVKGISSGSVEIKATSTEGMIEDQFTIDVIDNRIDQSNLQQNIIDVIAQTKNSILGVSNYVYNTTTEKYERNSIGSGVIYKAWFVLKDGSIITELEDIISFDDVAKYCYYLITNRHVIIGSDQVKIYLHQEEREIPALLMQYDDKVDLAVIYFEYDSYLKPIEFANSDLIQSGQFAIAIGNPSGYQYSSSATFGIISYPKRYISDDTDDDGVNDWDAEYIQHDVAINPGNSGGPLLDLSGRIIGINTLKFASNLIDNMGFSIPSNVVLGLIDILEDGRKPVRALLGVTVVEVRGLMENPDEKYPLPDDIEYGIYVISVGTNSVANRGGILEGDIILTFNGVNLTKSLILRSELGKIVVGSNVEIEVEVHRNGEIITLTLVF